MAVPAFARRTPAVYIVKTYDQSYAHDRPWMTILPKKKQIETSLDHYYSLESMEGVPPAPAPAPGRTHVLLRLPKGALLHAIYQGVIAAGVVGIAATFLSQHYNAPVMLFALLLGMAFRFLHEEGRCVRGIEFSARTILRIGVALLGLRITFGQIASLGVEPVAIVVAGVATTILLGLLLARLLGLGANFGYLSGGAVGICGASAALAISSALPPYDKRERDTVLTVVGVTTLSTIAMVFYPMLARALGLGDAQAGMFLGGAIHDVAQVVGAGYTISQEAGDVATYVKLLRVATLIPVVLILSLLLARRFAPIPGGAQRPKAPPFPLFLAGFVVLVVLNSLAPLPPLIVQSASTVSSWCLVTAIAALGMKTSLRDLLDVGWKPVGLMVAETIWIAGFVLLAMRFIP
jgi:uncharacterized integral membrane protein (TIGR00698 family)